MTVDYVARRGELEHKVGRGWLSGAGKHHSAPFAAWGGKGRAQSAACESVP